MGGQACVIYGAAEFTRDIDLAVDPDEGNLARVREALETLGAEPIVHPPLSVEALERGHACHFRTRTDDGAKGMRIDLMAVMRGCGPFPELWERRRVVQVSGGSSMDLLSLPDLVRAKKTQRDKDWPMIRRLVEADIVEAGGVSATDVDPEKAGFWFLECRTPGLLLDLARERPRELDAFAARRPLLELARAGDRDALEDAILREERAERALDAAYWAPLRRELEEMRRAAGHERTGRSEA